MENGRMASSRMSDDEIASVCQQLEGKTPEEVLRWAVDRFGSQLLFSTAFGAEGCCILHMLAEIGPHIRFINLDTGYQFPETLELRERIRHRYGIDVESIKPELTVEEYEREHGGPLYELRSDQCCHDRKELPLRKAVIGHDAYITSIRRNQTKERANAKVVQWDPKFKLVKVNPILKWTM